VPSLPPSTFHLSPTSARPPAPSGSTRPFPRARGCPAAHLDLALRLRAPALPVAERIALEPSTWAWVKWMSVARPSRTWPARSREYLGLSETSDYAPHHVQPASSWMGHVGAVGLRLRALLDLVGVVDGLGASARRETSPETPRRCRRISQRHASLSAPRGRICCCGVSGCQKWHRGGRRSPTDAPQDDRVVSRQQRKLS
jgi:hypothetical protein